MGFDGLQSLYHAVLTLFAHYVDSVKSSRKTGTRFEFLMFRENLATQPSISRRKIIFSKKQPRYPFGSILGRNFTIRFERCFPLVLRRRTRWDGVRWAPEPTTLCFDVIRPLSRLGWVELRNGHRIRILCEISSKFGYPAKRFEVKHYFLKNTTKVYPS